MWDPFPRSLLITRQLDVGLGCRAWGLGHFVRDLRCIVQGTSLYWDYRVTVVHGSKNALTTREPSRACKS